MNSIGEFAPPSSVGRRMACMLYETLLLVGVVFIAGLVFGILTKTHHAMSNRIELQFFLFIVIGVYFVWFWTKGQTVAMKTWHLHIRATNGAPVSLRRAFLRYLMAWLWVLPPLALASTLQLSLLGTLIGAITWLFLWLVPGQFHRNRQLLHDTWSSTKLVYVKPSHKHPR